MVLLHDVFHLVQILFGKFIGDFENALYFVVNGIKGIKVLLFEFALLCLVDKKWDFICDFFVIFHGNFHPLVLKV